MRKKRRPPRSYSAEQLRCHAAHLQELIDALVQPPGEWLQRVQMTIWALETSALVADRLEQAICSAAKADGFAILPPVLDRMRAEAIEELLAPKEEGL
jgi:hypothetical protein